MKPRRADPAASSLWAPRYWGVWIGFGLIRTLVRLPFGVQMALGRGLGRLAWRLARRERRIGRVNLRLCLPELDEAARTKILREHLGYLGCGIFDTALAWWATDAQVRDLTEVEGGENLQRALQAGRGALLVTAHFTATELGVRALSSRYPVAAMYQIPRNPAVAAQFRTCHERHSAQMIASDNVRGLLRALKEGLPVWFAADQRESERSSTLAPFFGLPVISNTAPARIARMSGAPLLPYFIEHVQRGPHRKPGYRVYIGEPLADFPSQDDVADAGRLHALVEAEVRRYLPQYLWTYKRFKRPGFDPYKR